MGADENFSVTCTLALCFAPRYECALLQRVCYAADEHSTGHLASWEAQAVNGFVLCCHLDRETLDLMVLLEEMVLLESR